MKLSHAFLLSSVLGGCATPEIPSPPAKNSPSQISTIQQNTQKKVEQVITFRSNPTPPKNAPSQTPSVLQQNQIYNKSFENVGKIEMKFLFEFFREENSPLGLQNISKKTGITGAMDDYDIKKIYENFYIPHRDTIKNPSILKRIDAHQDLLGYKKIPRALYGKIDALDKDMYLGLHLGEPIENTFINERLVNKIPAKVDNKNPFIAFDLIEGKSVLKFYNQGNLIIASYVSPGVIDHKTPKVLTYGERNPDMLHFSNQYPEIKGKKGGAVMPYAVHVYRGIWIHASDGKITGFPESHGCIRIPIYYAKELFTQVQKIGIKNVRISTYGIN